MRRLQLLLLAVCLACAGGARVPAPAPPPAPQPADAIYENGRILTMEGDSPRYAEAVAVRDGRIAFVGARADAERFRGEATRAVDLHGHAMLPGFVDAGGSLLATGELASAANLLPPPDGPASSIPALTRSLSAWSETGAGGELGWIVGMGYEEARLREQRPPTRQELDLVSKTRPVIAIQRDGRSAVANSKALALLHVSRAAAKSRGARVGRASDGTPSGLLEGPALASALQKLPRLEPAEQIAKGQAAYAAHGFTAALEAGATPSALAALAAAAGEGKLFLDVASYADASGAAPPATGPAERARGYVNHYRVAGWALALDGAPASGSAWLTQPYLKPPAGRASGWRGEPQLDLAAFDAKVDAAFAADEQLFVHASGDAAIDHYIDAVREAGAARGAGDRRPIASDAQTARADQLDAMKQLGIVPSFPTTQIFYQGESYRNDALGPARAANVSPERWALARALVFTSHHGAPFAFPDALRAVWSQVTRNTRKGKILGPAQRVSPYVALRATTLWAAYQQFQERERGSIEAGKLADFAILDRDPLQVPFEDIAAIRVLETVKDGKTIYTRPAP